MEATVFCTASTVALSAEQLDHASAHASPDTREVAARRPVRVLPPRTRPRTGATAHSTAQRNTAPSAELPGHARAHVKQVMEEAAARLSAHAPLPQIRPRMEAMVLSTVSTAALSAEQLGLASARANPGTSKGSGHVKVDYLIISTFVRIIIFPTPLLVYYCYLTETFNNIMDLEGNIFPKTPPFLRPGYAQVRSQGP